MTFQVTESSNGCHVVREIKVGIRVFPGTAVDPSSEAHRAFTLEEIGPVVAAMRRQVAFVYHEFTAPLLRRRRHRVTYRFIMRIEPTRRIQSRWPTRRHWEKDIEWCPIRPHVRTHRPSARRCPAARMWDDGA